MTIENMNIELNAEEQAELAALEAELGMDFDDDSIDVTEHASADLDAIVADVEMEEAKAEAYEEQAASADDVEMTPVVAKAPAKKASRVTMTGAKKSEVVKQKLGENLDKVLKLTTNEAADASKVLASIDTMAVKVGEKAVNLIACINDETPDRISVYSSIAFKFIADKPEGIVVKDLFEHYKDQKANGVKGYGEGTARSQSHQMFQLLPQLMIGVMNGKTMKLNDKSTMAAKLKTLLVK